MKFTNNYLFLLSIILFLSSCTKGKYVYIEEANKNWINYSSEYESFLMKDVNNITIDFQEYSDSTDFIEGSSAFLAFTYNRIFRESISKEYMSYVYNNQLSISLEALYEPSGDELLVKLNKTAFSYDLNNKIVTRIVVNPAIHTEGITEYVSNPEDIKSSIKIIETTIANKVYKDVLHFTLKDLINNWSDFTVTEIYIAKGIGLIKYKLNNGITYERVKE